MGSTFDDTVLDFDLNFLQHSSNVVNESRIDKQRKAILIAKKKTIATDSLIKKYFLKKEQLEQNEVVLLAAKEECKQVCIDYKQSLEKCTQLEKEVQFLQNINKELEVKCEMTQNQVDAIKSHNHQLQVLAKEHETVIESLKIENQLEKNTIKEYDKNLSNLQNERKLLSDLYLAIDIALGKKKLNKQHKLILQKYDKARSIHKRKESVSESSCEEIDLFDSSPLSPLLTEFKGVSENKKVKSCLKPSEVCIKKDLTIVNDDNESDYSNEIVSEDTGRGSSLAFSDADKCFNSPDYFNNDSPFTAECNKVRDSRVFIDACTSPTMFYELVNIATSPILFNDEALLTDNYITTSMQTDSNSLENLITTEIITNETIKLVDVGTNTNTVTDIEKINVSTSPIAFEEIDLVHKKLTHSSTSPIPIAKDSNIIEINTVRDVSIEPLCDNSIKDSLTCTEQSHTSIENLSSQCELEISNKSLEERKCLEINNSNNLCNENSNDGEIEMILNSMRLTDRLITPIPKTPVKLTQKCNSINQISSPLKQLPELPKEHTVCPEATKLREENRVLQTSITNLSKEIMNIKCILKKQHLMPETPKKHVSEERRHAINLDLFEDSSEETLSVNINDGKDSSIGDEEKIDEVIYSNLSTNKEISPIPAVESITTLDPIMQNTQDLHTGHPVNNHVSSSSTLELQQLTETAPRKEKTVFETNTNKNISESGSLIDSQTTIKDKLRIEYEVEETFTCDNDDYNTIGSNRYNKNKKCKKLSRLERFRKKLIPKSKIKRINVPIRKLCSKSKPMPITNNKNEELIMKNKSAFEKAVKVMSELKIHEPNNQDEESINRKVRKIVTEKNDSGLKESNNTRRDSRCNSKEEHLSKNISTVEIKQPVICLSQLTLNTICNKEKKGKNIVANVVSPKKPVNVVSNIDSSPTKNFINTRSRSKIIEDFVTHIPVKSANSRNIRSVSENSDEISKEYNKSLERRRRLKRVASDNPTVECKRVLRSQNVRDMFINHAKSNQTTCTTYNLNIPKNMKVQRQLFIENNHENQNILNKEINTPSTITAVNPNLHIEQPNIDDNSCSMNDPKDSVLCKMIEKYGKCKIKFSAKKIPDDVSNSICKKLEENISKIIELPTDKAKSAMTKLVEEIQHSWSFKIFLAGFMKYLKDPARKRELYNKISSPPAPPMTKSEQVLLFVMRELEMSMPNTVSSILTQIEFSLFQLNRTPDFDIIESLSHFYALLCRYFGFKNRLRLFLLDAMYCLQFKVVPLITQCLDVWMHILPLAHMGIAKSPLVTCLVYLLHFYKCEDKFNRIREIRFILNKKYFYQITDWNETKILEMFRNSIKELRDIKIEKKLLRMAFIILAKRQGPKWCQKNIIKNMLIPMIEKEDVPIRIKQFCVELLGPLLKPYPIDMKVHCEIIVNQLLDMLDDKTPDSMKEAIFTSLIYMNKHNQNRVTRSLLSWMPNHVSPEFEELMRDFVQEKSLKVWKGILTRTVLCK